MPHDVVIPARDGARNTCVIAVWRKRPGDAVARGDVLFEMEDGGSTTTVEAAASGYLADVSAGDGCEVPAGRVVARIIDSSGFPVGAGLDSGAGAADGGAFARIGVRIDADVGVGAGAFYSEKLPEGREVIMPVLGMAQDSGLLVNWLVDLGAKVSADDPLFEVETDKSVVEVPACADGYLAAQLAEPGQEVPTGGTIAILSATPPESTIRRGAESARVPEGHPAKSGGAPATPRTGPTDPGSASSTPGFSSAPSGSVPMASESASTTRRPDPGAFWNGLSEEASLPGAGENRRHAGKESPTPGNSAAAGPSRMEARKNGSTGSARVLASPKARRMALREGLDLARLAEAGHPQPFHAKDIETLRAFRDVPEPRFESQSAGRRLTAEVPGEGLSGFCEWAANQAGLTDSRALLAGLAGGCLGRGIAVAVEFHDDRRVYSVPSGALGEVAEIEAVPPDLILRDLRASRVTDLALGPEEAPVLTLARLGDGLRITLECGTDQLSARAAVGLLSEFAGRVEDPLRHLL